MEPIHFAYWMQGALELGQLKELNTEQVKIVQDHLNLVLRKVTPSYNLPKMPPAVAPPIFRGIGDLPQYPVHDAVC